MQDRAQKTDLIQAYSDSLHVIWLLMTVVSAVALMSSLFTKEFTLEQEHNTKQGFDEERIAGSGRERVPEG